jgi:ATP-binding protein involved in chromosome partitioning
MIAGAGVTAHSRAREGLVPEHFSLWFDDSFERKSLMRIAIPIAAGRLAQHFGHCEKFALVDVDPIAKQTTASTEVPAPEHQPGLLPPWLKEHGVNLIIAGGMGSRAHSLFQAASIDVLTGAPAETAAALVRQYLDGNLVTGANSCDH